MSTLLNQSEKEEFAVQLRKYFAEIKDELIRESESLIAEDDEQHQTCHEFDGYLDLLFDLNFGLNKPSGLGQSLRGIAICATESERLHNNDQNGNII